MTHTDFEAEVKRILFQIKEKRITPEKGKEMIETAKQSLEHQDAVNCQTPEHKSSGVTDYAKDKERNLQKNIVGDIAVIGMSGRFPGADNLDEFWENLSNGVSSVTEVPKERWDISQYYDPDEDKMDKTNSKWGGFLKDIDKFDPAFFNISGMEAEVMDPQQRIFLEECWKALEDAGYANDYILGTKCGVFVGAAPRDYLSIVSENTDITAQAFWGNTGSILASRISYFLNLKGPAITIETACSSSLVSIHLACQSIRTGECDMAIAGGIWICTTPYYYIYTSNAGMLSPEGKCKTFDNEADGIVNGECAGSIILKDLNQAVRDGDSIYGVIKGSCINQDGKTNGITAPSSISQSRLELDVYEKYNINPETITFVEAHGTGTRLGDPIEVDALKTAFQKYTNKRQFCALGSVKTNIGHASIAAGIASVIKVLLALKNKKIPPSLNFIKENEQLDLKDSPFYVNTELKDWFEKDRNLRAAVSSFGFSGTNAHLVIEEYKNNEQRSGPPSYYLAPFSGRTKDELLKRMEDFLVWSKKNASLEEMRNICYSLSNCRKHFNYRKAFVVGGQEELNKKIDDFLNNEIADSDREERVDEADIGELYDKLKKYSEKSEMQENLLIQLKLFYESGRFISWEKVYSNNECKKVHLPVYPLKRDKYWVKHNPRYSTIHLKDQEKPLVHDNKSGLNGIRYMTYIDKVFHDSNSVSRWNGHTYFLWSNFIEMFFESGKSASEKEITGIMDMVCTSPEEFPENEQMLETSIYSLEGECYAEICGYADQNQVVYAQGRLLFEKEEVIGLPSITDIESFRIECRESLPFDLLNKRLADEFNIIYGQDFFGIMKLAISDDRTMALVDLAAGKQDFGYTINPGLVEMAFKLSLSLIKDSCSRHYYFDGFKSLVIYGAMKDECSIYIKLLECKEENTKSEWRYDVLFADADGGVVSVIHDYKVKGY